MRLVLEPQVVLQILKTRILPLKSRRCLTLTEEIAISGQRKAGRFKREIASR